MRSIREPRRSGAEALCAKGVEALAEGLSVPGGDWVRVRRCEVERVLTKLAERPKEYIVVTVACRGDGEGEGFVAGPPVADCLGELRDRVAELDRAVARLRRGRRARRKSCCRAVALDVAAVGVEDAKEVQQVEQVSEAGSACSADVGAVQQEASGAEPGPGPHVRVHACGPKRQGRRWSQEEVEEEADGKAELRAVEAEIAAAGAAEGAAALVAVQSGVLTKHVQGSVGYGKGKAKETQLRAKIEEQEEVVNEESRCSAGARVTAACSVQSLQNALGEQARGDLEASGLVDDVCDSLDEAGAEESEEDEVENASGVGDDAYGSPEEASAVESEESEMEEDEAVEVESGESGDECDLSAALEEPPGA